MACQSADLVDRVKDALRRSFPGARVRISEDSEHRVYGEIVATQFQGASDRQRQQQVWGVLSRDLSKDDLVRVSLILTTTPEESAALEEDGAEDGAGPRA